MVSKSGRKTNFSKEEELLMAALGRVFPEANNKVYDNKRFQKFNSQNQNGIKREMNQIQGCRRRLKQEHDLQSREARKTSGRKALSDLEVIRRKEANVTKKDRKEG